MQNAVAREAIQIELAGKAFTWPRPVRKVARSMMADIARIDGMCAGIDPKAMTPEMSANSFDGMNVMLDFLYEYHPEISRRRAFFDDAATEQEIAAAFRAVSTFVAAPFDGSRSGTESPESSASPSGAAPGEV